ncbi:MAG: hypothetical protein HQL84_02280 [Magnetococcales bacterium]|nr:hypothetical protein [Magnetococcales bacterium]MBF0148854.1 hypothetical protein [Magnetococcales bacterium]
MSAYRLLHGLLKCLLFMLSLVGSLSVAWTGAFGQEGEIIRLLTYHNHPPFVTGHEQGVSYDLARMLTRFSAGRWNFQVRIVPRSRLDLELAPWIQGRCSGEKRVDDPACHDDWSLMWVNPSWGFGAGTGTTFRWVNLFEDANAIISLKDTALDYQSPESLVGLRFGGMRGHHYLGLDPLIAAGRIQRIDGDHERENLVKLLMKRLDAVLLPESTTRYFLTRDDLLSKSADRFFIAPVRHQRFWRQLMIPPTRDDLETLFQRWLATGAFPKEVTGE